MKTCHRHKVFVESVLNDYKMLKRVEFHELANIVVLTEKM